VKQTLAPVSGVAGFAGNAEPQFGVKSESSSARIGFNQDYGFSVPVTDNPRSVLTTVV